MAKQGAGTQSMTSRGGIRIGIAPSKTEDEFLSEAVSVAKDADAVVLLVGLNSDFESEGFDRPHMRLPPAADKLAEAVLAANANTAVVVQSGTPVEMPWAKNARALLQSFYGGNEVGTGIADVLWGKINLSARLPLTFPHRLEDSPSHLNLPGENGKVHYAEGIFVGYRHFDTVGKDVLFPFGAVQSYTTFSYSDAALSGNIQNGVGRVVVSVKVTSTGGLPGRETVQVYVRDVQSRLQRPAKELKGYAKTAVLQPGQSETVSLELDRLALGYFDDALSRWVAEKGDFRILFGASSADIRQELEFVLEETFTWL